MGRIRQVDTMMVRTILTVIISLASIQSHAQSFCFLSATTYYQQVYCELQAKGEARSLPPFHQFKKNDETIQAVLLKRPAARAGIALPPPKRAVNREASSASAPVVAASRPSSSARSALPAALPSRPSVTSTMTADTQLAGCELSSASLTCAERRYTLTGNRLNHRLGTSALTADNFMALPSYQGADDSDSINAYLATAYRQYIKKMNEIGLAGATMTYGKFSFLFYDLREKGLNFSQRFETMYGFLKKDKASMGVSEKMAADDQLRLADCQTLDDLWVVCSRAGRNYLYLAESDSH